MPSIMTWALTPIIKPTKLAQNTVSNQNLPRPLGTFALVRPIVVPTASRGITSPNEFTNTGLAYGYYPIPPTHGNA